MSIFRLKSIKTKRRKRKKESQNLHHLGHKFKIVDEYMEYIFYPKISKLQHLYL